MSRTLNIFELTMVVVAYNHNPTILNKDFLQRNDIVPNEWELELPPICTEHYAQVVFESGVGIFSEMEKVVFVEKNRQNLPDKTPLPIIVRKFVETLPHVNYCAFGINPKGVVEFPNIEAINDFLFDHLIKRGEWSSIPGFDLTTNLALHYRSDEKEITMNIRPDAGAKEDEGKFGLVFNANFISELSQDDHELSFNQLIGFIDSWQEDVTFYKSMITDYFLKEK